METVEELVIELNKALKAEDFTKKKAADLIEIAVSKFKVKIRMLDFAYYNELTQMCAKEEKLNCVKSQDFECAASQRELERKCDQFIELRKQYKVRKTSFYYEENYLFYLYLGKTYNDRIFKELLINNRLCDLS